LFDVRELLLAPLRHSDRGHEHAFTDPLVGNFGRLVQKAAGVAPEVEHDAFEVHHGAAGVGDGCAVGLGDGAGKAGLFAVSAVVVGDVPTCCCAAAVWKLAAGCILAAKATQTARNTIAKRVSLVVLFMFSTTFLFQIST